MARRRHADIEVELTEGSLRVKSQDKILTLVSSQPPPDAQDPADFVVCLDDIAHWDAPNDEVEIEIECLQKILHAIELEFDKLGLTVEFE